MLWAVLSTSVSGSVCSAGVAGQGEVVGMPWRQQKELERGAPHMEGAPSLGAACKIPGGTTQAMQGLGILGIFVAQVRAALG